MKKSYNFFFSTLFYMMILSSSCSKSGNHETAKGNNEIRIGYSTFTPIHCMIAEVLKRTEILENHGFKGKFIPFMHGKDQGEACEKGLIDATFSCEVPAIIHLWKCPDMRIIASPGSLGRIALVVPESSKIKSIDELLGRRILVHGGASSYMELLRILSREKLVPGKDIEIIDPKDNESIEKTILNGSLDALITWDPWLECYIRKNRLRILERRLFWSVIFFSRNYMQKNPGASLRYLKAIHEALFWSSCHKDEVIGWVSEQSHLAPEVVSTVLSFNDNYHSTFSLSQINTGLSGEHHDLLRECSDFAKDFENVPRSFSLNDFLMPQVLN